MIQSPVKALMVTLFVLFLGYGLFLPHYPVVNADELWETSRGYYLKTHHRPGEPLLPESVAPFYSSIGNMGWKSWCILTVKTGTFAAMMTVLPVDELSAMRYGMFFWSLLFLFLTYLLARKLKVEKWPSMLAVALMLFVPDFFAQIHRERSEILIGACLLAGLLLFLKGRDSEKKSEKLLWYFIAGLFSWMPSLLIHPSAIIIPGVIGVLYLIYERKNLFSLQTIILGIGLAGGAAFFLYIMNAMKEYAIAAGGGNYFQYQGPPILMKGWKYLISLPYAFYNRFLPANILSRPVSFVFYAFAFVLILLGLKKKNNFFSGEMLTIGGVSILVSLAVLYLLSGSFGNYNVIILPFVAIFVSQRLSNWNVSSQQKTWIPVAVLLLLFFSNIPGFAEDGRNAKEYSRLTSRVQEKVDRNSPILGLALYYNPFKDNTYYSNSWFNPYAGRIEQSFDDAVKVLGVKYVIVDDAFVGRALLDRGRGWTDSMFVTLQTKGEVVDSFPANYFVGNRVPTPSFFPDYWKYDGQEKAHIRLVKIYHLKD